MEHMQTVTRSYRVCTGVSHTVLPMEIVDPTWALVIGALALLAGSTWVLFGVGPRPVPVDADRDAPPEIEGQGASGSDVT